MLFSPFRRIGSRATLATLPIEFEIHVLEAMQPHVVATAQEIEWVAIDEDATDQAKVFLVN